MIRTFKQKMTTLLNAIKDSQLIDLTSKDKSNLADYLECVVVENASEQKLVLPSAWLANFQYKETINNLLDKYSIAAIVDLGPIWAPITAISFTLLALTDKKPKNVVMAQYKEAHLQSDNRAPKAEISKTTVAEYTPGFHDFLRTAEVVLTHGINKKTDELFFSIPVKKLDLTRLDVAHYHPKNQLEFERYKKANFIELSKLANVESVPASKMTSEQSVIDWSKVGESDLPIKQSDRASYQLAENDVVVMQNFKKALVINKALSGSFAPSMSFVIKISSKDVTPEYICLYLQSEIATRFSLKMSVGSLIPRIKKADLIKLPILMPDSDTLKQSKLLHQQLSKPDASIDTINSLIAGKQDKGRLQDSFLLEELEKLRISKRAMIERIIKDDLKELKVCIDKGLYKASMVICGSVLEAVILDWLSEIEKHDYYQDAHELSLSKALSLLHGLGELDKDLLNDAHNIRKMRNLIHPKNYLQNQGKVTKRECMKLLAALKAVINAYSRKN